VAERRPLVILDSGKRGELPNGDTLPGGGGTGGGNLSVCLTDGTTIFSLGVSSGVPVCLSDGTTIFTVPLA